MSFFIQNLHLNFHSFIGFQFGSGSSVQAIIAISTTLPWAIGLKCLWFLIALLLAILKVNHIWIIFPRSQRSLPTKPVFKRILTKAFCRYMLSLMAKKKLGSFNDLIINTYFQSFICLPRYQYEHFLGNIFCKASLALLNRIQPILERLKENIMQPWKPSITDRFKWC